MLDAVCVGLGTGEVQTRFVKRLYEEERMTWGEVSAALGAGADPRQIGADEQRRGAR